jgi:hypothetical protein
MGTYSTTAQRMVDDPEAGLSGVRDQLLQRTNDTFAGAAPAIQKSFARRGMAKSGKVASAIGGSELQRYRALAGAENDFSNTVVGERSRGLQMLYSLLGLDMESESSGAQTNPGNVAGGALGGGLSMLAGLLAKNGKLGGGSGGGGGFGEGEF